MANVRPTGAPKHSGARPAVQPPPKWLSDAVSAFLGATKPDPGSAVQPGKIATEYRQALITRAMKEGYEDRREFASLFGVTLRVIEKDVREIRSAWRAEYADAYEDLRAAEAARLDYLYGEAVKGWRGSQATRTRVVVKKGAGEAEVTRTEEQSFGDPSFLRAAMDAVTAKARLMGLSATVEASREVSKLMPDGSVQTDRVRVLMEGLAGATQEELEALDRLYSPPPVELPDPERELFDPAKIPPFAAPEILPGELE